MYKIVSDAVKSLIEVHSKNIIHRNFKPDNLLYGADCNFKLCDFGSATNEKISEVNSKNMSQIEEDIEINTTPLLRAPEQLDLYLKFEIDERVDIWSLGILIYFLMFGEYPFTGNERLA